MGKATVNVFQFSYNLSPNLPNHGFLYLTVATVDFNALTQDSV
jgi:hypothetical protein